MEHEMWMEDTAATVSALRSQLNQMAAASQVLEHSMSSEREHTYLAMMNQGICRMLRIVGRLELGSRLNSIDTAHLPSAPLDLSVCLEELYRKLSGVLGEIGIGLDFQCPGGLYVRGDRQLLEQMVLELCAHLALAGTRITLSAAAKEGTLYLTLKDTGPGSTPDRAALPRSLEKEEEQTSLSLARRIAQLHGGALMYTTGEDLSLTITVSLPPADPGSAHTLESPRAVWNSGGFDPVLVAMSDLLPARSFLSQQL